MEEENPPRSLSPVSRLLSAASQTRIRKPRLSSQGKKGKVLLHSQCLAIRSSLQAAEVAEQIREGRDQVCAHFPSFTLSNFVSEQKAGCRILGEKSLEGRFAHSSHLGVLLHTKFPLTCAFEIEFYTNLPSILNVFLFRSQNKNWSVTAYCSVKTSQNH